MSGRIRSIKPELLEDERTSALSDTALRIFISLFLLADDHGNFRADPAWLKSQIFWRREPLVPFNDALQELGSLVQTYCVRGQRYGHICGWSKHQKVDKPGKPRVPVVSDPEAVLETLATPSRESREALANVPETLAERSTTQNHSVRDTLARPSRHSRETLATDLRSPITDHRSPTNEFVSPAPPTTPVAPDSVSQIRAAPKAKPPPAERTVFLDAWKAAYEAIHGEPPIPPAMGHILAAGAFVKRAGLETALRVLENAKGDTFVTGTRGFALAAIVSSADQLLKASPTPRSGPANGYRGRVHQEYVPPSPELAARPKTTVPVDDDDWGDLKPARRVQ